MAELWLPRPSEALGWVHMVGESTNPFRVERTVKCIHAFASARVGWCVLTSLYLLPGGQDTTKVSYGFLFLFFWGGFIVQVERTVVTDEARMLDKVRKGVGGEISYTTGGWHLHLEFCIPDGGNKVIHHLKRPNRRR